MIIGYARVSTKDQNLNMQINAIKDYAENKGEKYRIFQEKESGGNADRKELKYALDLLAEGDTFVVFKLDRLARSTKQLIDNVERIDEKGADFVSLSDSGMDTTSANGRLMFQIMGAFAEFERQIIRERTKAGLQAARESGKVGGRPKIDTKTKRHIKALKDSGESATDISKEYGIGRSTVYKIINEGLGD